MTYVGNKLSTMALMLVHEHLGYTFQAVTPGCGLWRPGVKQWKAVRLP